MGHQQSLHILLVIGLELKDVGDMSLALNYEIIANSPSALISSCNKRNNIFCPSNFKRLLWESN